MIWLLRVLWAALPVTAGTVVADAADGWPSGVAVVAASLAWAAWGAVVLALFVPRPLALTVARIGAPAATVAVALAAFRADTASAVEVVAVVEAGAAAVLVWSAFFARACADAVAYGDERRFPLRTPPGLLLGPVPVAVALVAAGVSSGPLLLGDRRWALGAVVTVAGLAVAFAAGRSLHGLSLRWVVLVPNGLVVVDPMTLAEPPLLTHAQIARIGRAPVRVDGGTDVMDLRLGAVARSVRIDLSEPATLMPRVRRHRTLTPTDASALLVAPLGGPELGDVYAHRRPRRV
ncbi:MAG: hypothetical protein R3A49_08890 [Acidimicrobiia bacterium]